MEHAGRGRLLALICLLLLSSITEGMGLILLVPITQVIAGGQGEGIEPDWLAQWGDVPATVLLAGVVALVTARALIVFATNHMRSEINISLTRQLRMQTHQSLLGAEWRWLAGRHSADHGAVLIGEASRAATLVDQALFIASAGVTMAILAFTAVLISPPLALTMFFAAALIAVPLAIFKGRSSSDADAYAEAYNALHRNVSSGLGHMRSARLAGASALLSDSFAAATNNIKEAELRYVRHGHWLVALVQIAAAVLLAGLVYFAMVRGSVVISVFVPLLLVLARTVPLISALVQGIRQWRYGLPALARLRALLAEAQDNAERVPSELSGSGLKLQNALRFDNVTLQFDGRERPVLDGFAASVPAGSIAAVIGPSGSGKSSLADIASGLLAPTSGQIWVDEEALTDDHRIAWRSQVAYAEQSPFFFAGTVRENIAWGQAEAQQQQVEAAIDAANAQFVFDLPQGLDTEMFEDGRSLSGGERQRIALARALLREPQLLILDEITAALDRDNRAAVAQSIARLKNRCTILLLTHDESLLSMVDQIIDLGAPLGQRADV